MRSGERGQGRVQRRGERRLEQLGLRVAARKTGRAGDLGCTEDVARQHGGEGSRRAVVVVHIDPQSPAAARGRRVDDIITGIDQSRVMIS